MYMTGKGGKGHGWIVLPLWIHQLNSFTSAQLISVAMNTMNTTVLTSSMH